MELTNFLLFLLATVGMTSILVRGVIFQPFREFVAVRADKARQRREERAEKTGQLPRRTCIEFFHDLVTCCQCTGFWCGLLCGFPLTASMHKTISAEYAMSNNTVLLLLVWFACGTAGSFAASFGDVLLEWVFYHKMVAVRRLEKLDRALHEEPQRALGEQPTAEAEIRAAVGDEDI